MDLKRMETLSDTRTPTLRMLRTASYSARVPVSPRGPSVSNLPHEIRPARSLAVTAMDDSITVRVLSTDIRRGDL